MPITAALLKQLAKGPIAVATAFQKASPKLRRWKPGKDKWSVCDIVAHLLDVEVAYSWRLRHIVGDAKPTLVLFDENSWARELHYSERDARAAHAAYAALRLSNIDLARCLSAKQAKKKGVHPDHGPIDAVWLLERFTKHDAAHLAQIERNRAAYR